MHVQATRGDTLIALRNYKMTSAPRALFPLDSQSSLLFSAARELATERDGSVQSKGQPTTDSANVGQAVAAGA